MKSMNIAIAMLFTGAFSACGSPSREANKPTPPYPALEAAVARVKPLLHWGCGLPAESNTNCSGDGVSMAGRWLMDGGMDVPVWEAVKASIDPDGRPWRNPERPSFDSNSFSRDQLLGLVEATIGSGEKEPLQRVHDYYTNNRLCPGDERCDVTPSVSLIVREVLGHKATSVERLQDETTINAEALTSSASFRSYLVARKLNIHASLGNITTGYKHAARVLKNRYPYHIFYRYVDLRLNGGDFFPLADILKVCLVQWQEPGVRWWGDYTDVCNTQAQGHELVALGMALIRG